MDPAFRMAHICWAPDPPQHTFSILKLEPFPKLYSITALFSYQPEYNQPASQQKQNMERKTTTKVNKSLFVVDHSAHNVDDILSLHMKGVFSATIWYRRQLILASGVLWDIIHITSCTKNEINYWDLTRRVLSDDWSVSWLR